MKSENVIDYADMVLGFEPEVGTEVEMEEETKSLDGTVVLPKGSRAVIRAIELRQLPEQLTVTLEIFEAGENPRSLIQRYSENHMEPSFPFGLPLTQEQLELNHAEAARKAEEDAKKKADAEAKKKKEEEDKEETWRNAHGLYYGYH